MTIRAVRVHQFAEPERLEIDTLPLPTPGIGEVRVRTAFASINPVDWKIAEGAYSPVDSSKLPVTLGRDLSGTIEQLGPETQGWSPGDRVSVFINIDRGTQAEAVIVRSDELVRVPKGVSLESAGAVPLAAITAWQGLFDHGQLQPGQRVLIHGAAGGVGHLAVQLARWKGCTILATASARDLEFVRGLGADIAIDYEHERFERIASKLDLVFDTQGGDTQARSFATLREGGTLISTLETDTAKAAEYGIRTVPRWHASPDAKALAQVLGLMEDGDLIVEIDRQFVLDQVREAHAFARHEHPRGKILLACANA